jgi:hypothetical protein
MTFPQRLILFVAIKFVVLIVLALVVLRYKGLI